MTTYLWKKYAEHLHNKWEKTFLWAAIEHYRRPKTFTPLVEKYWEEHPGEAVPMMKPRFYYGPWKVLKEHHNPPTQ
ncbi:hypothetical protein ACHQM5_004892 [Ranunculus cassubicifolius]